MSSSYSGFRRDLNQLADDLTNENFACFDPNFRVDLKGEALEWRVLGRLLAHATSYFEELGSAKKAPATRFAKRPRKLGPWCFARRLASLDGVPARDFLRGNRDLCHTAKKSEGLRQLLCPCAKA